MIKLCTRSLLGLPVLAALLGSTVMPAAAATPAQATRSIPTVQATLRDNLDIAGMQRVPPNLRYEFTRAPRYTLQVQGANFVPSARVQMALIDTASMQTLHKASVYAQSPISGVSHGRPVQNPLAGTFQYQANIQSVPVPADVHLWCRSVDHLDIHNVKME